MIKFPVPDTPEIEAMKQDNCYNSIPALKAAGVELPLTEEQVNEIRKCQNDFLYFVKNYVVINTLDKGQQIFELFPFQEELIMNFRTNRFNIAMLPRQMGKSACSMAYILWKSIFTPDYTTAILAHKETGAKEVLDRFKVAFMALPWYMKPGVAVWNMKSIVLSLGGNGTKVFAAPCTVDAIIGKSCNCVYIDEAAHIDNFPEFFGRSFPTLSSGKTSQMIITSTPKGMNYFWKLYTEAEQGVNGFVPFFAPWYLRPDRDEEWYETQKKAMTDQEFNQEYLCEFLGSSATLVNGEKLKSLSWLQPLRTVNNLAIYREAEEGKKYVVSVDVSEGLSQDYSVATVIDISGDVYEQVAVYRDNHILPENLAEVVYAIATKYNNAYVIIENNSIGRIVCNALYYDMDYEYMLTSNVRNDDVKEGYTKFSIGLRQTPRTKSTGCAILKALIESDSFILNDADTITELFSFTKQKTSYQADNGKTDDCVMTLVNFAWLTKTDYFREVKQVSDNAIRRGLMPDDHIPFGILHVSATDGYSSGEGLFLNGIGNVDVIEKPPFAW